MSQFDPIASRTVRTADYLEPSFFHGAQVEIAKRKLADHLARRKKHPNVLIFLMDDVGWGDFGCYGEVSPSVRRRRISTSLPKVGFD